MTRARAVSATRIRAADREEALREPLYACANGELAPNVALARLIALAGTREDAEAALVAVQQQFADGPEAERMIAAGALWRGTPRAWERVRNVLSAADHGSMIASAAAWAARFDRAARVSPEASAALYSLGRPDILDAAAQSIVLQLRAWGLTGQERAALDLGCGGGRLAAALAPYMRRIVGVDVSVGMLSAAHERCRNLGNVALVPVSGEDLAAFPDCEFDLVVAADVFPYIASCGGAFAQRQMAEARRVLAPGGALLILNYCYGLDEAAEAGEAIALADRAGLQLVRVGRGDFDLWDGRAFHFRRPEVP